MPLLMAKAEVGVAVAEPETPIAQALDLAMAPAIPMIVLLRVLLLLVDLVRVLVVAVGKVMINMPQVTEEGVHLAQAMVTHVITLLGLHMQMDVGAAVAPEEVSAMAKGMVTGQGMGKVLATETDWMVQATQIVVDAEVDEVVVMMVDLAVVLARGREKALELLGVPSTMMTLSGNHHHKRLANHQRPLVTASANHHRRSVNHHRRLANPHRPLVIVLANHHRRSANHHWLIKMSFILEQC